MQKPGSFGYFSPTTSCQTAECVVRANKRTILPGGSDGFLSVGALRCIVDVGGREPMGARAAIFSNTPYRLGLKLGVLNAHVARWWRVRYGAARANETGGSC